MKKGVFPIISPPSTTRGFPKRLAPFRLFSCSMDRSGAGTGGMDGKSSQKLARERWQVLRNVLLDKKSPSTPSYSPRRHNSLSLFDVEKKFIRSQDSPTGSAWQEYSCRIDSLNEVFSVTVKTPPSKVSNDDLYVKDNTGNICIWASEQVMAYHCIKNLDQFGGKAVIELGGGYSCLAGAFTAKYGNTKRIVLSDGNEKAIANVMEIAKTNSLQNTELLQLSWDDSTSFSELLGQFDFVLCADCLFQDAVRAQLAQAMFNLLKPCGEAIIFAPKRGNTFDDFVAHAKRFFGDSNVTIISKYDDKMWEFNKSKLYFSSYNENIHYPLLLRLKKSEKSEQILTAANYA